MSGRPKVLHIKSAVQNAVPSAATLDYGEIAVNYAAGKEHLFIKNASGEVVTFSTDAQILADNPFEAGEGANSAMLKGGAYAADGDYSVAEGLESAAVGSASHAEGNETYAGGDYSHSEGENTYVLGQASHGEGTNVFIYGDGAHGEGISTYVASTFDVDETMTPEQITNVWETDGGYGFSVAKGDASHVEGQDTLALGHKSHAEGRRNVAGAIYSHAEGEFTRAQGARSHAEGAYTFATGADSHAENEGCLAQGINSHAEGYYTKAAGITSHAEGASRADDPEYDPDAPAYATVSKYLEARGQRSHAEGYATQAFGDNSHAEGVDTLASGGNAHAEGSTTVASGTSSHAEGYLTTAYGLNSHAEGCGTYAGGDYSHAEGYTNNNSASRAAGWVSHVEGFSTQALNKAEHAEGYFNKSNSGHPNGEGYADNTVHSIGIGFAGRGRTNAFEIMQNGDAYLYGVGGYNGTNATAATAYTLQSVISGKTPMVETTWSALKSLRDSSGLTSGMQYRITDYNTTTVQANTQAAGHQFDIIVVADDNHTLNENARATSHTGDMYFTGATLEAWELKYDIDNDTTRFAWADTGATGRGVIYYMKDEWGNECPYDFKNIQFARWEQTNPVGYVFDFDEDVWDYVQDSDQSWVSGYNLREGFYSFNGSSNSVYLYYDDDLEGYKKKILYTVSSTPTYCYTFGRGLDASLGKNVYSNVIREYYNSNKLQLNNIVFLQTILTQNCHANTFGYDCRDNTFGYDCNYNTFGNYCYNNTFVNNCYDNTFEYGCNYNAFRSNCYHNAFKYQCHSNIFKDGCYSNIFVNNCHSNIFVNNCYNNTFGDDCYNNTFGDDCYNNTFGSSCCFNTFGSSCYDNVFGNGCGSNTFGHGCRCNTFSNSCGSNTFGSNCQSNTFGDVCGRNTFGDFCNFNTFGESVQYFIIGNATGATTTAQAKGYIRYLVVENGVKYVNAYCTGTTSSGNCCQNIKIGLGLNGKSPDNRLQIDITSQIGATTSATYQPANSKVISV